MTEEKRTEIAKRLIAEAIAAEAELEALRAKVATLTAALEEIRDLTHYEPVEVYEIARAALAGKHRNPS